MGAEKTFCEFFAGIGLVGEGLRPSGWSCVYANDINADKQELYEALNGPSPYYHLGDVNRTAEVVARVPGRPALATASFPCVDLSLAGHYRGLEGRESSTFFAFAETLRALGVRRPPLVLLENVPGFLTSRQGRDFVTAAETMAALGYRLDALVLDARHFTPQSRRRVFVVGAAGGGDATGRPAPEVGLLRPANLVKIMATLPLPTGWLNLDLPDPPERGLRLEDVIDLDDGQAWWETTEVERHYRMMSDGHRRQVDALRRGLFPRVGTAFRRVRGGGQRAEVRFDGLAGCLRTPRGGSGKQIVVAVDAGRLRMRWMSPREYARLQGAPDFPLVGGRNQQLFGFGDAVCVPAVAWVDRHILTPLYESITPHPDPSPRCTGERGGTKGRAEGTDMPDNLSPEHRRKTMQAVKGSNTSLERAVDAAFRERGWACERHVAELPGKPDFVFPAARLVVFVDGDFWHGWRFPLWCDKLTPYWKRKIERTRRRDRSHFRRLRRMGWRVLRLWGHQVEKDLPAAVRRVALLLRKKPRCGRPGEAAP